MQTPRITEVPMLQGHKNYVSWRAAVEARFRELDVYDHAIADQTADWMRNFPPEDPIHMEYKLNNKLDEYPGACNRYDTWNAREVKARRVLRDSIPRLMFESLVLAGGRDRFVSTEFMMMKLHDRYTKLNHAEAQYDVFLRWYNMKLGAEYAENFINDWSIALTKCIDAGIEVSEDVQFLTLVSAIDTTEKKSFKEWVCKTLAERQMKHYKELWHYFRELIDIAEYEYDKEMAKVGGDPRMVARRVCGVCGVKGHVSRGCWHLLPELAPKELEFEPDKKLAQEFLKRKESNKRDGNAGDKTLSEEGDIEEVLNKNSGEWEMVMRGLVWYKDHY